MRCFCGNDNDRQPWAVFARVAAGCRTSNANFRVQFCVAMPVVVVCKPMCVMVEEEGLSLGVLTRSRYERSLRESGSLCSGSIRNADHSVCIRSRKCSRVVCLFVLVVAQ